MISTGWDPPADRDGLSLAPEAPAAKPKYPPKPWERLDGGADAAPSPRGGGIFGAGLPLPPPPRAAPEKPKGLGGISFKPESPMPAVRDTLRKAERDYAAGGFGDLSVSMGAMPDEARRLVQTDIAIGQRPDLSRPAVEAALPRSIDMDPNRTNRVESKRLLTDDEAKSAAGDRGKKRFFNTLKEQFDTPTEAMAKVPIFGGFVTAAQTQADEAARQRVADPENQYPLGAKDPLYRTDLARVRAIENDAKIDALRPTTARAIGARIMADAPTFLAEMGMTGGAAGAAGKIVGGTGRAARALRFGLTSMAQGTLMPGRTAESAARRMQDQWVISEDELGNLQAEIQKRGDPALKALFKGWVDTGIEAASERMGEVIMPMLGRGARYVATKTMPKRVAEFIAGAAPRGGGLASRASRAFTAVGAQDPLSESLEERIGEAARVAIGIDEGRKPGETMGQALYRAVFPGWDQLAGEMIGFSLFGGARLASEAMDYRNQRAAEQGFPAWKADRLDAARRAGAQEGDIRPFVEARNMQEWDDRAAEVRKAVARVALPHLSSYAPQYTGRRQDGETDEQFLDRIGSEMELDAAKTDVYDRMAASQAPFTVMQAVGQAQTADELKEAIRPFVVENLGLQDSPEADELVEAVVTGDQARFDAAIGQRARRIVDETEGRSARLTPPTAQARPAAQAAAQAVQVPAQYGDDADRANAAALDEIAAGIEAELAGGQPFTTEAQSPQREEPISTVEQELSPVASMSAPAVPMAMPDQTQPEPAREAVSGPEAGERRPDASPPISVGEGSFAQPVEPAGGSTVQGSGFRVEHPQEKAPESPVARFGLGTAEGAGAPEIVGGAQGQAAGAAIPARRPNAAAVRKMTRKQAIALATAEGVRGPNEGAGDPWAGYTAKDVQDRILKARASNDNPPLRNTRMARNEAEQPKAVSTQETQGAQEKTIYRFPSKKAAQRWANETGVSGTLQASEKVFGEAPLFYLEVDAKAAQGKPAPGGWYKDVNDNPVWLTQDSKEIGFGPRGPYAWEDVRPESGESERDVLRRQLDSTEDEYRRSAQTHPMAKTISQLLTSENKWRKLESLEESKEKVAALDDKTLIELRDFLGESQNTPDTIDGNFLFSLLNDQVKARQIAVRAKKGETLTGTEVGGNQFDIQLPSGYVRSGDRYVYQPTSPAAPEGATAPQPEPSDAQAARGPAAEKPAPLRKGQAVRYKGEDYFVSGMPRLLKKQGIVEITRKGGGKPKAVRAELLDRGQETGDRGQGTGGAQETGNELGQGDSAREGISEAVPQQGEVRRQDLPKPRDLPGVPKGAEGQGVEAGAGRGSRLNSITSNTPVADGLSYDEFKAQYEQAFSEGSKYKPSQIGSVEWMDRMAALAEKYPEFESRVYSEQKSTKDSQFDAKPAEPIKSAYDMGREGYARGIQASAQDKAFLDTYIAGRKVGDRGANKNLKDWMRGWAEAHNEATGGTFAKPAEPGFTPGMDLRPGTGQSKPVPGIANAEYNVYFRKANSFDERKFRAVITNNDPEYGGRVAVDGKGMSGEEAYREALREYNRNMDERRNDAEQRRAAAMKPTEPAKTEQPMDNKAPGAKSIGTNPAGYEIREDENGVRSFTLNGIKHIQAVRMVPTRSGIKTSAKSPEAMAADGDFSYLTTEEIHKAGGTPVQPLTETQAGGTLKIEEEAANGQLLDRPGAGTPEGRREDQPDRNADRESVAEPVSGDLPRIPGEGDAAGVPAGGTARRGGDDGGSGAPEGAAVAGGEPGDPGIAGGAGKSGLEPDSAGEAGERGRGNDGALRSGDGSVPAKPAVAPAEKSQANGSNWIIQDLDYIEAGGDKSKYRDNVAAIRVLKALAAEQRRATPEEQAILSKYVGWGRSAYSENLFASYGYSEAFRKWEKEREELKALLTDEEFESARASTINAHWTHPRIASGMWRMLERMGFRGGKVHENSIGAGIFFGTMPVDVRDRSSLSAGDMDSLAAQLSQALYPGAKVTQTPFQEAPLPENFFDTIIGNFPFGDITIRPDKFNKIAANLHDYFFLKSVAITRPGGIVAAITSTGTLDKMNSRTREVLAEKADLVAAFRLPAGAFQKSSGTDVVTDIIILRRRFDGEAPSDVKWKVLKELPDPDGGDPIAVNEYFADHPENILGTLDRKSKMYSTGNMHVSATPDFAERFEAAIARLPEDVYKLAASRKEAERKAFDSTTGLKDYGHEIREGKLWQRQGGEMVEVALKKKDDLPKVEAMLDIRRLAVELQAAELADATDANLAVKRKALNRAYDSFTKKYGWLNKRGNASLLKYDPDWPILVSLEDYNDETETAEKADIFAKRVMKTAVRPDRAQDEKQAIGYSLNETGALDIRRISELLATDADTAEDKLVGGGYAFRVPGGGLELRDYYLSGNVREKLIQAEAAAKYDSRFRRNAEELRKVIPEDVPHSEIEVRLGSPWIPAADYQDFFAHLLGTDPGDMRAAYLQKTGRWLLTMEADSLKWRTAFTETYGTPRANFLKVAQAAMDDKAIMIYDVDRDGNKSFNADDSAAANMKVEEVRDLFREWIWSDDARRARLHRYYNDTMNNVVETKHDGAWLDFPTMSAAAPKPYPHQQNAVARLMRTRRMLAAHEVGSGKTMMYGMAAAKMKELGYASKPALVVLKANIEQITSEIQRAFPTMRILSTSGEFDAKSRRQTIARIASGDWDLVIMTHDNFNMLDVDRDVEAEFIRDEIKELEDVIRASEAMQAESRGGRRGGGKSKDRTTKQLEKMKQSLEEKLKKSLDNPRDPAVTFQRSGIDMLLVDEAHKYKSLPVYTTRGSVKGIPQSRSDRATNMRMHVRWMQRNNPKAVVVFGTGTPIDNSMVELYNWQTYLQPEELEARGIESFDGWANTFGQTVTKIEPTAAGEFKPTTRFKQFTNLKELSTIARQMLDTVFIEDMPWIKRPKRVDSVVNTPLSAQLASFMAGLAIRAKDLKGKKVEKGSDNMLAICTDGRKSAIHMGLVTAKADDGPEGKVNRCVENVLKLHRENPGATQMIFSDIGVNEIESTGFHLYQHVIRKLVAGGIPKDKIIDFTKLKDGEPRETAIKRLKSGDALVGIGSTEKMGTGVNAQTYLKYGHHLDAPLTPGRLEQRVGRFWRQGNTNAEVTNYIYVTEGSLDAFVWSLLNNKASFIRQFLKDGPNRREITETDTEEIPPARVMAIASGNPDVLAAIELDDELTRLVRKQRVFETTRARAISQLDSKRRSLDYTARDISELEAAVAEYEKTKGAEFSAVVEGKTYAARDGKLDKAIGAAAEKIDEEVNLFGNRGRIEGRKIGSYKGFDLVAGWTEEDRRDSYRTEKRLGFALKHSGGAGVRLTLTTDPADKTPMLSILRSADGMVRSFAIELERDREAQKGYIDDISKLETLAAKKFDGADEIARKRMELADIQKRLAKTEKDGDVDIKVAAAEDKMENLIGPERVSRMREMAATQSWSQDVYLKRLEAELADAEKKLHQDDAQEDEPGTEKFAAAGLLARTADKSQHQEATRMEQAGQSREAIWRKTGWWKGPDGQWRFEIDDSGFKIKPTAKDWNAADASTPFTLETLVEHEQLFAAYPWLRDIQVTKYGLEITGGALGAYSKNVGIYLAFDLKKRQLPLPLIHEIQHAIQEVEGFARGGSPYEEASNDSGGVARLREIESEITRINNDSMPNDEFQRMVKPLWNEKREITKRLSEQGMLEYRLLAGEVESRFVQRRLDLPPMQRQAIPPWQTMETMLREEGLLEPGQKPEDALIFRKGLAGTPAESRMEADYGSDEGTGIEGRSDFAAGSRGRDGAVVPDRAGREAAAGPGEDLRGSLEGRDETQRILSRAQESRSALINRAVADEAANASETMASIRARLAAQGIRVAAATPESTGAAGARIGGETDGDVLISVHTDPVAMNEAADHEAIHVFHARQDANVRALQRKINRDSKTFQALKSWLKKQYAAGLVAQGIAPAQAEAEMSRFVTDTVAEEELVAELARPTTGPGLDLWQAFGALRKPAEQDWQRVRDQLYPPTPATAPPPASTRQAGPTGGQFAADAQAARDRERMAAGVDGRIGTGQNDGMESGAERMGDSSQDREYLAAVERGDTATAQRIVDESAETFGVDEIIDAYEDAEFDDSVEVPDGWYLHGRRGRSAPWDTGYVIQLTKAWDWMGWGDGDWAVKPRASARVLDFENAYSDDMDSFVEKALKRYPKDKRVYEWIEGSTGEKISKESLNDAIRTAFSPEDIGNTAEAYDNPEFIEWLVAITGADMVKTPDGGVIINPSAVEYVDLGKRQARAIVRDDSGRIIPPSERFNSKQSDIRYAAVPRPSGTEYDGATVAAPDGKRGGKTWRIVGADGKTIEGGFLSKDTAETVLAERTARLGEAMAEIAKENKATVAKIAAARGRVVAALSAQKVKRDEGIAAVMAYLDALKLPKELYGRIRYKLKNIAQAEGLEKIEGATARAIRFADETLTEAAGQLYLKKLNDVLTKKRTIVTETGILKAQPRHAAVSGPILEKALAMSQMKPEAVNARMDELDALFEQAERAENPDMPAPTVEQVHERHLLSVFGGLAHQADYRRAREALKAAERILRDGATQFMMDEGERQAKAEELRTAAIAELKAGREAPANAYARAGEGRSFGRRLAEAARGFWMGHEGGTTFWNQLDNRRGVADKSGRLMIFNGMETGSQNGEFNLNERVTADLHAAIARATGIDGTAGRKEAKALRHVLNGWKAVQKKSGVFVRYVQRDEQGNVTGLRKGEELKNGKTSLLYVWLIAKRAEAAAMQPFNDAPAEIPGADPSIMQSLVQNGYTAETIREIEANIGPQLLDFGRWMVEYLDQHSAPEVRRVTERLFGAVPPIEAAYFPIRREHYGRDEDAASLSARGGGVSMARSWMKLRVPNLRDLRESDAIEVFMRHMHEINHVSTHLETVDLENRVMKNQQMQKALAETMGERARRHVNGHVNVLTTGGVPELFDGGVNQLMRKFARSVIPSPTVMLKQTTSYPLMASFLPPGYGTARWMADVARMHNPMEQREWNARFNREFGYWRQRFGEGWNLQMRIAMKKEGMAEIDQKADAFQVMSNFIRWGDKVACLTGGVGVFKAWRDHYTQLNKSKPKAEQMTAVEIERAAYVQLQQAIEESQQSGALKDMASVQTNPFMRMFMMFKTQPLAISRLYMNAIRGIAYQRGDAKSHWRTITAIHLSQALFQFVADAFWAAALDDDDEWKRLAKNQIRAQLLAPINGYFMLYDLAALALNKGMRVPVYGDFGSDILPWTSVGESFGQAVGRTSRMMTDGLQDGDWWMLSQALAEGAGVAMGQPIAPVLRIGQGMVDAATDDTLNPVARPLRAIGYGKKAVGQDREPAPRGIPNFPAPGPWKSGFTNDK